MISGLRHGDSDEVVELFVRVNMDRGLCKGAAAVLRV